MKDWMPRLLLRLGVQKQRREPLPDFQRLTAEIIEGLRELAFGWDDGILRLAGQNGEDESKSVGGHNLLHVSRMKLSKDGALEAEFVDRYRAVQMLLEILLRQSADRDSSGFYQALENAARALGRTEGGCGLTDSAKNS